MKIKNFDNVVILRPKKSYFNDGSRFEGQSNKLKGSKLPDGYGKLYYPNGHIQYKGNFKNGGMFRVNSQTVDVDTTIEATENATATGPLTVSSGITITVNSGGSLAII